MTKQMENMLKNFYQIAHITRGKNKNKQNGLVNYWQARCFDGRTIVALLKRGLLEYQTNTIYGDGYRLTVKGIDIVNKK
jgi:hypothetical protein